MLNLLRRARRFQLLLALVVLPILPWGNRALVCRSDPVVILSNGMTLDIGAGISTLPMQVTEVHYELHVPKGVKLVLAIHTPAWLTSQETFTVIDDQAAKQYKVVTTAHTTEGDASVSADTLLVSALKLNLGHYSASGKEGEPITVSFKG